jgi:hypothetical protein
MTFLRDLASDLEFQASWRKVMKNSGLMVN